jgi:pimeloyl-ACP methyl ester carboxylesterase
MNITATPTAPRTLSLGNGLEIAVEERGERSGSAVLLLHGGAGPRSVAGLSAALSEHVYVVTPTHPGFENTPRVAWLDSVADLADAYLDLIEELELETVMVIGNSLGGWIAAEMALRDIKGRVKSIVLINATGIRPDADGQIVDVRTLQPTAITRLSFHNPDLRPDFSKLTDEQRATGAANQRAMAVYAGEDFLFAPKLRRRLGRVTVPALVIWGEQDGVLSVDYGRAYAESFANGHFAPIAQAGHFPQIEQPGAVLGAIGGFVDDVVKPDAD